MPTYCSRAFFLAVTFLASASRSSLGAQGVASKPRPSASSAASSIPLENNGASFDIAGLAGIRIAHNGAVLFADIKPVTLNVSESRDGSVRQIGRAGAGPGEYKAAPNFVGYRGDSIVAYDASLKRWSLLSPNGMFVRILAVGPEAAAFSQSAAWVSNGAIVFNASIEGARAPLVETISQVSAQMRGEPLIIRQVSNGNLWVAPTFSSTQWTVFDRAGRKRSAVQFPTAFRLEFANDTVAVGAVIDANDAPQIMRQPLRAGAVTAAKTAPVFTPSLTDAERAPVQAALIKVLRNMVGKQEGVYSDGNTYTSTFEKLRVELPDGMKVSIVDASKTGWFGIALDQRTRVTCAMGVGYGVIGWSEAQAQCSK
ncbi:MAG: hypothetical protein ABI120_13015 [Gemmatimonadaceae bacterium]